MSTLKVDTILKRTGTGTITLGQSGDTISIPSGATITNSGTNGGGFGISEIVTPYAARMYNASNQNIQDSTWTELDLTSSGGVEVFDKGNIATLSNARITVPSGAGGLWCFYANLRVNNFRAARNILQFYKNGSATTGTPAGDDFETGYQGQSGQYHSVGGTIVLNLSAGDYIAPYFYQNSGGTDTIFQRSFTGWYLGASS